MTKLEILSEVAKTTGIDRLVVQRSAEAFTEAIKGALIKGEPVFIRGFGSFVLKKRAKKIARNIRKNTSVIVPEHYTPVLKPAKEFAAKVRNGAKTK